MRAAAGESAADGEAQGRGRNKPCFRSCDDRPDFDLRQPDLQGAFPSQCGSLFGPGPPWVRSDSSHGVRGGSDASCETHGRRESTSCPHLGLHPLGLAVAAHPCGQAGQVRDPPQGSTEGPCVLSPFPPLSPRDVMSLPSSNQAPGRATFLESQATAGSTTGGVG